MRTSSIPALPPQRPPTQRIQPQRDVLPPERFVPPAPPPVPKKTRTAKVWPPSSCQSEHIHQKQQSSLSSSVPAATIQQEEQRATEESNEEREDSPDPLDLLASAVEVADVLTTEALLSLS